MVLHSISAIERENLENAILLSESILQSAIDATTTGKRATVGRYTIQTVIRTLKQLEKAAIALDTSDKPG